MDAHFVKGVVIVNLKNYYENKTTEQLYFERQYIEQEIEDNDGRLSAESSYELDYLLDKKEIINNILARRI